MAAQDYDLKTLLDVARWEPVQDQLAALQRQAGQVIDAASGRRVPGGDARQRAGRDQRGLESMPAGHAAPGLPGDGKHQQFTFVNMCRQGRSAAAMTV